MTFERFFNNSEAADADENVNNKREGKSKYKYIIFIVSKTLELLL